MYKGEMHANVRRACLAEGTSGRETSQMFGLHREVVRKMLAHPVPPGYQRQSPARRPKQPFTGMIDAILEVDAGFGCRANQRGNLV